MRTATAWRVCPACDPSDNEWPAVEFTRDGICRACALDSRPRVERPRKPCAGCGKGVRTLAHIAAPVCRSCRRERNPRPAPVPVRLPSLRGAWQRTHNLRRAA